MDGIRKEFDRLQSKSNLSKSIKDIDHCLQALIQARNDVEKDPSSAPKIMAKLENVVKDDMNKTNEDIKDVYSGLTKYGKAIEKRYSKSTYPISDYDALSGDGQDKLIERAIAMHLIREGRFEVADTFYQETKLDSLPTSLKKEFESMYKIKDALRERDLAPAIQWAADRRTLLEHRGSNLEFELHRLRYVYLFTNGPAGPAQALAYGRREFAPFQQKYLSEIRKLTGALAFVNNLSSSPYAELFNSEASWTSVANSFTREFCALLHLSAESPLYVAVSAGSIALQPLIKMSTIMKEKRTEWTSRNELPVDTPLPAKYQYHSIFVCPVSKEQTTEDNPPMMLPCGHVLAQESLTRLAKNGSRFKCPYCPIESMPKDAKRVYL